MTIARLPWKIKPTYRVSLNRANPITRDLIRYWPCGGAHLLDDIVVGHRMIPERNIVQRATQRGSLLSNTVSGDFVGDAYDLGPSDDLAPTGLTTYSLSMWLEGRAPSGTTGRRAFHIGRNAASPSATLIGISVNESGSAFGAWAYTDNTETFQTPNWSIAIHDDGLIHHCVLTIDGAASELHGYIDGEEDFEDLSITLTATRGTGPAYLGGRGPVTDQAISDFGDCGIWQRVLSAAEVRSLFEDPYQIYQPRSVFLPTEPAVAFGDLIKSDFVAAVSQATFTPDLGSNPKSGNLLIATVCAGSATAILGSPPSGFTLLHASSDGGGEWHWFFKISDGTEQTISATWTAVQNGVMRYVEYEWDGSTPVVTSDENTDNIDTVTSSQPSGAALPPDATNICIAMHATDGNLNSFDNQAVDGLWIEDFAFLANDLNQAEGKLSRLVNAPTSLQEATHSDGDDGDQMYGAIAIFTAPAVGPTPPKYIRRHLGFLNG